MMRRVLCYLASRSALAVAVLLVGAAVWLGLGIVNINFAPLAKAGGCGHFCGTSVVDACADPNPFAGSGPVASNLCGGGAGCPAGQQCYYCCIGCAPPPGAPPGANGCWQPPSDTTPPVTTHNLSGPVGANGWYVGGVQVTLSATDDSSGVSATYLDGTPYTGPRTYSAQGLTTIRYYSVDAAGHTETAKTASFRIDSAAPFTSQSVAGTLGLAGWYLGPVQLTLSASDATSGVWFITLDGAGYGGPKTYNAQGANPFSYFATDRAGNASGAQSGTIRIDSAAPTITGSRSPAPNASGWNNTNVTVTFTCADPTSGVASCPTAQTINTEGASQSQSGAATDAAGNSANATVSGISIDKIPPTISASLSAPANADGWHNADMTVTFACGDALSGVQSCPAPQTVTTEGANQTVTGNAADRAGNAGSSSLTINLDETAPTLTWSASPSMPDGASGWYVSPVTVGFACADALSGVRICPSPVTLTEGANQSVAQTLSDFADNTASTTAGAFDIDLTPPSLTWSVSPATADGDSGWYVTQPTVTFACSDSTSGIASCPSPGTLGDGADQSVTRLASDRAGLATSETVGSFNVDTATPTASGTLSGTLGANGWYISPVTVVVTGTDVTSGLANFTLDGTAYTAPRTYSAEDTTSITYSARDVAGNTSAAQSTSFKIDTVPPATTASLLGLPGAGGWYVGPVLVTLTSHDATSGVDRILLDGTPYTGPRLSPSGTITATYQAVDEAGNVELLQTAYFNVDTRPPVTTYTLTGTLGANGWHTSDVTLALAAQDDLSGVRQKFVNGAAYEGSLSFLAEGEHRVEFYAEDNAGNREALQTLTLRIDRTPPQITVNTTMLPDGRILFTVQAHDPSTGSGQASGVSGGVVAIMRDWKIVRHWNFDGETATVEWDGLDDSGQPVPAGSYTVWAAASDRAGLETNLNQSAPAALPTSTSTPTSAPTTIHVTRTPTGAPTSGPTEMPTTTETPPPMPTGILTATPTALPPALSATPTRVVTLPRETAQVKPPTSPTWPWLLTTLMPALGLAFFVAAVLDPRPRAIRRLIALVAWSDSEVVEWSGDYPTASRDQPDHQTNRRSST